MDTEALDRRIEILSEELLSCRLENLALRELLTEAGISFEQRLAELKKPKLEAYEENQGARIRPLIVTEESVTYFFKRFWGRMDVYELRHQNVKTGKVGYYTQCFNFWTPGCHKRLRDGRACKDCEFKAYKPLRKEDIFRHLRGTDPLGNDVVAVFPLFENNTCRFLVFDFDNHEKETGRDSDTAWKEEAEALRQILKQLEIDALIERSRSGHGAHVWIFFEKPVPAHLARRFGFALLNRGAETVNLKSFRYYDRMIPTQDTLPPGGLGNVIALPLQGRALREGNSAFVDENWNAYPNQLEVLWKARALSPEKIEELLKSWGAGDGRKSASERGKPWDKSTSFCSADVDGAMKIVLANRIFIDTSNLSPRLQNQLRRLAAFGNPVFYRNQAIGISNFKESRFIYLGCDEDGYIGLPRGLRENLEEKLRAGNISYEIEDGRAAGRVIDVEFNGQLRPSQREALEALLCHEEGILQAATAFGKTVVCCALIAQRKVNTLILIESSALMEQWKAALKQFLVFHEDMPEYRTKTGRLRKRKEIIGTLQGVRDTLGGIVDIAMVGSLRKNGELHPLFQNYGQILLDECHHAASDTIVSLLQEAKAKYLHGVTATPVRGDGKEKANFLLLGPIRYKFTAKDRVKEQGIFHWVYPRFTRTVIPHHGSERMHPNEAYEILRKNPARDAQILADVKACVESGRTPVVLTKYTDHAERLSEAAKSFADHVVLLIGKNGKKETRRMMEMLERVQKEESLILVATGKLIGEGFDYPRLDTLIMATPVAGRSVVEQYAGRLNRDYEGKRDVIIYDYIDSHIPLFERMYGKRLKAYKQIGYEIRTGLPGEKQHANAIFDMETYGKIFWRDVEEAENEIVISSPRLNREKVERLLEISGNRPDISRKVTVVTWNPDISLYGRGEREMQLLERLRGNGIHVELTEEACGHFAVIDRELVWYGNADFLAKEDVEDHLMRVMDRDIAAELLEAAFAGKNKMEAW